MPKRGLETPQEDMRVTVPLHDFVANMAAAEAAEDWRQVLQGNGRIEEMMKCAASDDDACSRILSSFSHAHGMAFQVLGKEDHLRSCVEHGGLCIPIVGKLQRFRDQGDEISKLAYTLRFLKSNCEAAT